MSRRSPVQNAELALLLEVAGTPKPGNVDRRRDYPDLRFEHFLAGAVGARKGLSLAAEGAPLGRVFERAVYGMCDQRGGNTQFGALLLLTPLLAAAEADRLSPEGARAAVEATTVADAADFYRAFEHVDVAVEDPPADLAALDVRRGAAAIPALEDQGLTLGELMARSAERDGVAREWTEGFPRTFRAAEWLAGDDGPVGDRASRAYLRLLAVEPDTFVRVRADEGTASEVTRRARAVLDGEEDAEALAEELVDRDVNPGTTADVTAGALFVALERGMEV